MDGFHGSAVPDGEMLTEFIKRYREKGVGIAKGTAGFANV
jgi:hypothetical protein